MTERPKRYPLDRFKHSHLVVGLGEVGSALFDVLISRYDKTEGLDLKTPRPQGTFDVLHICIPYSKNFEQQVRGLQKEYGTPETLTIIHSTVPEGTSRRLDAVHSPIRGVHPNMKQGIRTFTKFFGGEKAVDASEYFLDLGIPCQITDKQESTEAMKLWDTTQYGFNIVLMKSIYQYCLDHNLDFNIVYTKANQTYNEGYTMLGMAHVNRPVLKYMEGPIGGHCVVPNARLLDCPIADIILEADATY